jgi:hypothetical protein
MSVYVKGHARGGSIVRAYVRKGGDKKGTTVYRRNRAKDLSQRSWDSMRRAKSQAVKDQRLKLHFKMNALTSELNTEIRGGAKSITRRGGTRKHGTYSRYK